ncbi:MAG: sulfite oxidase-like oxidoreductase [Acidimicrobiia bacterium]|nr:sulfite oxidase-like oxidoreductase [Acidimicrobiia bacterium]MDH4306639.1 sulfite oxidase-like oxidoreductase [Acidimicrobiia bacterium]
MSFFTRKRQEYEDRGIDPARIPPGQYLTDRFPVLHAGVTPKVDPGSWFFEVNGLVDQPVVWTLDDIKAMPTVDRVFDIHCVTKWSKLDTEWHGVSVDEMLKRVQVNDRATHVLVFAEHGFTANVPLEDFAAPDSLFAWRYGGEDLDVEHGWPLRLVIPHLYFWKSVKWVRGFTLLDHDEPGFWERNGYHMYGDPFREQRYWGD